MKERHRKFDLHKLCFVLGLVLLLAGAALAAYNFYTDWEAGQSAQTVLEQMDLGQDDLDEADLGEIDGSNPVAQSGDFVAPEYWSGPMPEEEIDGQLYIGTLYIPELELELPIHTAWDERLAKTAPCRYKGSLYDGTLIIAGHNYRTHFSRLKTLSPGAKVRFTDTKGAVFWYQITSFEYIDMYDLDAMEAGDWDLTLFTCDFTHVRRLTARCEEISRRPPKDE